MVDTGQLRFEASWSQSFKKSKCLHKVESNSRIKWRKSSIWGSPLYLSINKLFLWHAHAFTIYFVLMYVKHIHDSFRVAQQAGSIKHSASQFLTSIKSPFYYNSLPAYPPKKCLVCVNDLLGTAFQFCRHLNLTLKSWPWTHEYLLQITKKTT